MRSRKYADCYHCHHNRVLHTRDRAKNCTLCGCPRWIKPTWLRQFLDHAAMGGGD